MSETPDQKLDRVTDEIVAMVDDWHRNDGWDEANAKTQIRRMLRDECSELWEASAETVEVERLEAENADLRRQLDAAKGESCESCGMWVQLTSPDGGVGECCLPYQTNAPAALWIPGEKRATVRGGLRTAFDFVCKKWIARPENKTQNEAGGAT